MIKFEEIKEELRRVLTERLGFAPRIFTLIEGFTLNYVYQTLDNELRIGGKNIPGVILVNNKTGELHHFALKSLLPNLDI